MLEMRCRSFGESFPRGVQTFREVSEFRRVPAWKLVTS